jgi:hypothetical protein
MPPEPVPADPGWDDGPAWRDRVSEQDEFDLEEEDQEDWEPLTAGELAEIREFAAADARVWAGMAGRRGPGQPGSVRIYPGESASRAAAFGSGLALDVMPPAPAWPCPPTPRPGTMIPTRAYLTTSCSECWPRGTGWRPTWRPASWPRRPSGTGAALPRAVNPRGQG